MRLLISLSLLLSLFLTSGHLRAETRVPFLNTSISLPEDWSNKPDASYAFYAFAKHPDTRAAIAVAKVAKNVSTHESLKKMKILKRKKDFLHTQRAIQIAENNVSEDWIETANQIWLIQSVGSDPYLSPTRQQFLRTLEEASERDEN